METKHTKEYAEKLASDFYYNNEMITTKESLCYAKGYMKAIEVTNVSELLEALIKMNDYFIHEKELTEGELEDMLNFSINAIKKATK